jgi:hypothetical protein
VSQNPLSLWERVRVRAVSLRERDEVEKENL